jgi:hypothetical protein
LIRVEKSSTGAPEYEAMGRGLRMPELLRGHADADGHRRFVHPDPRFAQTVGFTSIPQTTIPVAAGRMRLCAHLSLLREGKGHLVLDVVAWKSGSVWSAPLRPDRISFDFDRLARRRKSPRNRLLKDYK